MQIFKYMIAALSASAFALWPGGLSAQHESSVNSYSPYTMYGLGDLNRNSGGSTFVGMGGASIGFRNGGFDVNGDLRLNISNPASLGGMPQRSFIFDVGMAGTNVYMKQQTSDGRLRSSFNTFNFNNVTIAFPLAGKVAMSLNVSPFSQVGYRVHTDDTSYLADLGVVRYYYDGEGDITEAKASIGWAPFKRLTIGAEVNYLWGNVDRTYQAVILNYTGSGTYGEVSSRNEGDAASTNEKVGRLFPAFGAQYTLIDNDKTRMTLGATWRPAGDLGSTVTDFIPSNNVYGDTIRFNQYRSPVRLPNKLGLGVFFHRERWAVGADYIFEDWGAGNSYDAVNEVRYVDARTFKIGGQFTPRRYDVRGRFGSFFSRITYKAGVRIGGDYLEFRGQRLNDRAVTVGFDVPFRTDNVSMLSLGFEYGGRGTLRQSLVKEKYFRISAGVMLFGRNHDYWFEKYKYN